MYQIMWSEWVRCGCYTASKNLTTVYSEFSCARITCHVWLWPRINNFMKYFAYVTNSSECPCSGSTAEFDYSKRNWCMCTVYSVRTLYANTIWFISRVHHEIFDLWFPHHTVEWLWIRNVLKQNEKLIKFREVQKHEKVTEQVQNHFACYLQISNIIDSF